MPRIRRETARCPRAAVVVATLALVVLACDDGADERTAGSTAVPGRANPSEPDGATTTMTDIASATSVATDGSDAADEGEWPAYGMDNSGRRHSQLSQVTRDNVAELKPAWTYRTGELPGQAESGSAFQATPIMVDGTLYLSTPRNRVIALDPATGAERWVYDPRLDLRVDYANQLVSRGVSHWLDPRSEGPEFCRRRIFTGTNDGRLIALDAATGRPCPGFGNGGQVTLVDDIGDWRPGEYQVTSPPVIVEDLVIVGSAISDNQRARMPSGVVRAFDARSGTLRWAWQPARAVTGIEADQPEASGQPVAPPFGAANVWAPMSADPERDLVFLPTSSPSPDYFGGLRSGANEYANSVVALRASTGDVVWDFQVVHHDVWDYDVPAQPMLIEVDRGGSSVPAVVVATKTGFIFTFHRETGEPLFPIEEIAVPTDGVDGESLAPTQPRPSRPPQLVPHELPPEDAFGISAADIQWCRDQLTALRADGLFTPPTEAGTLQLPAYLGGMNWSGMSYDPQRQLLITNTNNFPAALRLYRREEVDEATIEQWERDLASQAVEVGSQDGTPYVVRREFLLSPGGTPCSPPPWGELVAVNMSSGEIGWRVPLGTMPELSAIPDSAAWGSLNLGGAITTDGGLVFIAASRDDTLRAFDVDTGKVIWQATLPAGGQATPMTYQHDGQQYIVIAAGGHGRLLTTPGDHVVAFALP